MKINPIQNFAHAPSCRSFQIGKVAEVTDKSGEEFIAGGLAVAVEEPKAEEPKAKKSKGE